MGKHTQPHLLLVDGGNGLPPSVKALLKRDCLRVTRASPDKPIPAAKASDHIDAALVVAGSSDDGDGSQGLGGLISQLDSMQIGTIVICAGEPDEACSRGALTQTIRPEVSAEELWGRISTIARYGPVLCEMDRQLANAQRVGSRLNQHFTELDQEMRLASRLQQDFLPRKLPTVGPAKFAAIYRPARWVSGDIYDVFQLDDSHVGFYVADAVGHGMASGLLTIFVKRVIAERSTRGAQRDVAPAGEVIAALNDGLAAQHLPNSQFVTACYCVLNTQTLTLSFARGGHPYPIRITQTGAMAELKTPGAVMGAFAGQEFPTQTARLARGDKLLLFSDGLEAAFGEQQDEPGQGPKHRQHFRSLAYLPSDVMCQWLTDALDAQEGSLNPRDDVTLVVLEIAP